MTDPYMIANAFNNYFASVGNNLANEIPNLGKSPLDYLKSSSPDSFFISPITSAEIEIEISKLKTGKATGPFSIPISVLKILKTVIAKPLEILFNTSFSSGIVPTKFKQASVVPVYKTKHLLLYVIIAQYLFHRRRVWGGFGARAPLEILRWGLSPP